jgi:hypothetical protein
VVVLACEVTGGGVLVVLRGVRSRVNGKQRFGVMSGGFVRFWDRWWPGVDTGHDGGGVDQGGCHVKEPRQVYVCVCGCVCVYVCACGRAGVEVEVGAALRDAYPPLRSKASKTTPV